MSDIMEKVAREMAVAEGWAITKSTIADYLPAADAALSACGYHEMVEALEKIATGTPDAKPPFRSWGEYNIASKAMKDIAQAALKKAKGET